MAILYFMLAFGFQNRLATTAPLRTDSGPSTASSAASSSLAAGHRVGSGAQVVLGGSFGQVKGEENAEARASSSLVRREKTAVVEVMPDGILNQVRIGANTEAGRSNAAGREQVESSAEDLFDEEERSGRRRRRRRRGKDGRFDVSGKGMVQYWRNHALMDESTAYDRAVIVIHGTKRNADDYYDSISTACARYRIEDWSIGRPLKKEPLLFVPRFKDLSDDPKNDELYWTSSGWKIGYKSEEGTNTSSFEVVDDLLVTISERFSAVTQIVIVGHSAGGQFVQRYAGLGKGPNSIRTNINVRYVVANPSSYMYLNSTRPDQDGRSGSWRSECRRRRVYHTDEYKYGMSNILSLSDQFPYATMDISDIQQNLVNRKVVLLLGTKDNEPYDAETNQYLDRSCPAEAQGSNRYERGLLYEKHVKSFDGNAQTTVSKVQGVGHKNGEMFASSAGRQAIFH